MITSTSNPKIKWLKQIQSRNRTRRQEGVFVAEGVRLVEEALAAKWTIQSVLHTPDLNERAESLLADLSHTGAELIPVSAHVFKAASDTQSPQGILAVIEERNLQLPAQPNFLLILDTLRDPGNLGTILRTAWAAGVQAALLSKGSVDAFSPKVVRAGMGAHFHLLIKMLDWREIESICKANGIELYLAESNQGIAYTRVDFRQPAALIIGGEASGAGEEVRRMAVQKIHIPMPGRSESLNAAAAAAVLIFEVVRQRMPI